MRAAICRRHGAPLSLEDVTLAAPRAGEIEVVMKAVAICHSDLSYISGDWGGDLPAVFGHEAAGVVQSIGEGVTEYQVGDAVCVTLLRSCGTCRACSRGYSSECAQPWDTSYSPLTDASGRRVERGMKCGAFAERVIVDPSQCARIPEGVAFDVASLMSCGVITGAGAVVNTAEVRPGDRVAVIGAGGVGLNTIQAAAISGASMIVAIDVLEEKLDASREFGATHGVLAGPDTTDAVLALTDGFGVDYVFVTVGVPAAFENAPDMVTKGGGMVIVGMPPVDAVVGYKPVDLADRSVRFLGSSMGQSNVARDIPWLFQLYAQGRLRLDELITGRWTFDQINEAIADTKSGRARRNVILFD